MEMIVSLGFPIEPFLVTGPVIISASVANDICGCFDVIGRALQRHTSGDWGDITPMDKAVNDRGNRKGGRVLSSYDLGLKSNVWVITEYLHSEPKTKILFPKEYA